MKLSNYSVYRDKLDAHMKDIFKKLPTTLVSNLSTLTFFILIFAKLIFFNYLCNLWPGTDQLSVFLIYNLFAAAIILLPALFIRRRKFLYLYLADVFVTIVLFVDVFYVRFFDTLPVISLLGISTQMSGTIIDWLSKLLQKKDIYLVADLAALPVLMFIPKVRRFFNSRGKEHSLKAAGLLAIVILFWFTALISYDSREKLPYLFGQISENKVVAKNIGIFGAHIMDISRNLVDYINIPTDNDIQEAFATIDKYSTKLSKNKLTGTAKNKRVVMIQVESLDNFTINQFVDGKEITPNLNQLVKGSSYFSNHFFTVGAGGTSDADYSANTSIPPLVDSSVFVKYSKNHFTSLAKELKKAGYNTFAYHGNNRGYWNRNTAFANLGFTKFYAKDNFSVKESVNMGLSDKSFFAQAIEKLKTEPSNSFDYLITLSSHYSFEVPENLKTLRVDANKYPKLTADYLEAIHYTDAALGQFINDLKTNGLYDDTLLVVYGDHTAMYDAFTDDSGKKIDLNTVSGKQVPLIIKLPGQTKGAVYKNPTSHWDIMPTILNLVGTTPTSPMFGRDAFSNSDTFFFTSTFENNFEQIVSGSLHYLNDGTNLTCYAGSGQEQVVNISECNNILNKRNQIQKATSLLIKHNLFSELLNRK